jgi:hypothetical protein
MNISTTSNCDFHWDLSLNYLRSLTFNIKSNSLEECQRIAMVERILDALRNLSSLVVAWKDFHHCSRKYLNLKHVHLLLDGHYNNPKRYFDIDRLHELVPHLHILETSNAAMMLNKDLVEIIVNINHQFDQFVHLILNKHSRYRTKREQKVKFKDNLIAAIHDQKFHCSNIHFEFRICDELCVWF